MRDLNIKNRLNYKIYIQVLPQLSSEARLLKAFELSEFSMQLFMHGLHKRFPNLSDEELKKYFWSVSINVTTGIIFENKLPYLQITRRKKNEERNSTVHYGLFWPNVVSNSLF